MGMTLGDAFTQRKKLDASITSWTNRLGQAGQDHRSYFAKKIEGEGAFQPEPGSEKISQRHYTIEECRRKLDELIAEDEELALRISMTNQIARATVRGMDDVEKEYTVPELLVLKNDIVPKMEAVARAVPTRPDGVNVFEQGSGYIRQRDIRKIEERKESFSDKGLKIEEKSLVGYQVEETTQYGVPQREAWDSIDRIQDFAERIKQAIHQANKTELVALPQKGASPNAPKKAGKPEKH